MDTIAAFFICYVAVDTIARCFISIARGKCAGVSGEADFYHGHKTTKRKLRLLLPKIFYQDDIETRFTA